MGRKFDGNDMDAVTRHEMDCNMKEGVTPEGTFDDWGDYEKDHRLEVQTALKCSTAEEVDEYWSTLRSAGVRIKNNV